MASPGEKTLRITPNPPPTLRDIAAMRRKGDVFSPADPADKARRPAAPVQPTTSVDLLVLLAAEGDEVERRRRMADRAERGLAMLEALDAEAQSGADTDQSLQELAVWAQGMERPQDPDLARLLEAIELRALVELAKHERDADAQ